jgi:ATPase family associated with various cellular activities (AAA)
VKFTEVRAHIVKMYAAGLRQTIYLSGPPGIGKSACVKSAAHELDVSFRAIQMTVVDPLDFGGLPAVLSLPDTGPYATRLPFGDLVPQEGAGILLYDDLPTAPPLSQAAAYRTIYERDHIGKDWLIVATGNRDSDMAATQRMPTPLVSKMGWIEFEPDIEGWNLEQAGRESSHLVRAFIAHRPDLFVTFDPKRPGPFATARTWEALADMCLAYSPSLPPMSAVTGWVGEGPATEFMVFATMAAQLVSPDTVLMAPDTAPVPEDPGALYAVTTALSAKATAGNFDCLMVYLGRLQPEFAVYTVKSALATQKGRLDKLAPDERRKTKLLEHTHAFVTFAAEHNDILT